MRVRNFFIPILLTLIFFLFFYKYIPLEKVLEAVKYVSLENFVSAFFFYTLSQVVRSIRWKPLIKDLSFLDIFFINSANIFFNNVLPARTGELSWFYYAKKLGVSLKVSVWSFFLGRVFDLSALIFAGLLVYSLVKTSMLAFLISFCALLASIFSYKMYIILPSWGKLRDLKIYIKDSTSLSLSLYLFGCSLLSVILKFLAVLEVMGMSSYLLAFLSFSFGELSTILPLHSFMGYGTYELSFSIPAKFHELDLKSWIVKGFLVHNFLLLSSGIYGIIALFWLHRSR
ncbi:MAG: lysylphosphatidylglycerol synthase domain-containing protein [Hydrogenobacter sp.]